MAVPSILIIDSHPGVQELLAEEFLSEGCRVAVTGEPDQVGNLVHACRPEMVILDPFLKGQDRCDVFRLLKTNFPHLPVLIVTAYVGANSIFSEADGTVFKSSSCVGEVKRKAAAILKRRSGHFRRSERRCFPAFGSVQSLETAG